MKKIRVSLSDRSYDVIVGKGAFKRLPSVISKFGENSQTVIISEKRVFSRAGEIIKPVIKKIPKNAVPIIVDPGEKAKTFSVFTGIIEKIASKTPKNKPLIVAIGGGVIGDLAGFVAATFRRGVPIIQVPTTLLAQVDSSIGGKTGIDIPKAKNLVGAFWQPRLVLTDPDFLRTLPPRQVSNGMAEIIKYGIIKGGGLFKRLEDNVKDIRTGKTAKLENIIAECAGIKAGFVEKDEFDIKDLRIMLNFGHTLGHAIESASGYSGKYTHGEAVSVGMVMSGEIGVELGIFDPGDLERVKSLLIEAGLPIKSRDIPVRSIFSSYRYDKKFTSGTNRFILPYSIGTLKVVDNIPESVIKKVIKKYAA